MKEKNFAALEETIGYRFQNRRLLRLALTHSSHVNEHKKQDEEGSNERLEFLGDAILDFVAAEYLYRSFPDKEEGELSKLRASMVSEKPLAARARDLSLPDFLRLGHGEELTGGRQRDSIVSDAMEAVIGAVYLDGGFEAAKELVLRHVLSDLGTEDLFRDKKTPLQEFFQDQKKQVTYEVIEENGPDHDKLFKVAAMVDGDVIGVGVGRTKKAAAQDAAEAAMRALI